MPTDDAFRDPPFDMTHVVLRVDLVTPVDLKAFGEAFLAVDSVYRAVLGYLMRLERALDLAQTDSLDVVVEALQPLTRTRGPRMGLYVPVPVHHQLRLLRVHAASPGSADLEGASGPLETLRRFWIDRDERRKGREWREDLERDRFEGENLLLDLERERIAAAVDVARTEAVRQRYELLKDIYGIDAARDMIARDLSEAGRRLDEARMAPRELLPAPDSASDDTPDDAGADGSVGDDGEAGDGDEGGRGQGPGPGGGGGGGGDDDGDDGDDIDRDPGGGDAAEEPHSHEPGDDLVDAIARELVST